MLFGSGIYFYGGPGESAHKQYIMEKMSANSHFITLQIDGQSPNLFSSNYITEAKKWSFNYIIKTNYELKTSQIIKLLPFIT